MENDFWNQSITVRAIRVKLSTSKFKYYEQDYKIIDLSIVFIQTRE